MIVRFPAVFCTFLAIACVLAVNASAIGQDDDVEMRTISGDPAEPRRHFRL